MLGESSDGTTVYVVAQDVLAGNENGNHEAAQPGKDDLYELHYEAGQWTRTFIAVLSNEDRAEWEVNRDSDLAYLTARVSANGQYLAFMSAASITGYDNTDQNSGAADEEVYLYDAQAASLRCVSCDPTGARPIGVFDTLNSGEGLGLLVDRRRVWSSEQTGEHWLAGNIPGWTAQSIETAVIQSRYLSNEGRMFFNSSDELVPAAKNRKEDVYEYEPSGLGSCESETGGCVSLISSGTSSNESAFMEATPEGSNAYFITAAQLLPQDTDTAFDIYDARICTALSPCLKPPSPGQLPCGSEEACRAAPPAVQAPASRGGSASGTSTGNLPPSASTAKSGLKDSKTTAKPLTRAQKLARALKACGAKHSKKKRQACERKARKLYQAKSSKKANTTHSTLGRPQHRSTR